ncbi:MULTISPECIES: Bax inhibitor-1/YccA family membrane protein [Streptomyces]|uniref:Bax inhibitor-1/YccA family membrane protein n=1 Tax=Streptomyces TaxID=1883 RepID=UPI0023DD1337|nr:Bax inhibitor-1/YccA family protein [Streptomyces sp. FXJ1.172]WEP00817.1 Bax inhibitor-1/YccA family protein [Streptomyces sp. FXJ1.172]
MTAVEQQRVLKSSNPVLSRPQFQRRGGRKTAARDPRAGIAVARERIRAGKDVEQAYEDGPFAWPFVVGDLMTMDDVLPRAAAGLGVAALATVSSWTLLPLAAPGTAASYGIAACAGLLAAALVVLQCRKNPTSAALALTFAALQGVFLGALSTAVSRHLSPGVLVQTVLGTMAAFAGVLLARRLHWMRVHRRVYGSVGAALLAACLLALVDWILYPLMGADGLGLRPVGLGVFMGVLGVVLGASFLSLHVNQVEDAIRHGASRDQSWAAAFGLTLTLTWLYVETVRSSSLCPVEDLY